MIIKTGGTCMSKILLVEDDTAIREELKLFLENNGYQVSLITSFEDTLKQIEAINCDMILMDINLPGVNGQFLCREIRKNSDIPIVMVTSRNSDMDELLSMNYGADDYIAKPYNLPILLVHMEAILKRRNQSTPIIISYKDMKLNVSKSVIETSDKCVELSKNEMRIFYYLLTHRSMIISRDKIMDYLWGTDEFVDDNTLTVNINRLRKKLEELGYEDVISTRRGQGYIIE